VLSRSLLIGSVFEVAAVVFFIAADDPYMSFLLALTGLSMAIMSYLLLHAQETADSGHASLPTWTPAFAKAKKPTSHPRGIHLPPPSLLPFAVCAGTAVMLFGLAMNLSFFTLGVLFLGVALVGWLVDSRREWRAVVAARGGAIENPVPLKPSRLLLDVMLIAFFSLVLSQSGLLSSAQASQPTPPPVDPAVPELTASGIKFDVASLTVKGGEALTLEFSNKDAGIPHNVAIREAGSTGDPIFSGEKVTGVTSIEYAVPALTPGTAYTFYCELHANMKGTINVLP